MTFIEIARNPLSTITLTFVVFWLTTALQRRTRLAILNPLVLTIAFLITFLKLTGISFEQYYEGGRMIEFWLKPAIVALALPLYNELKHIKSQFMSLFLTELAGCAVGVISVVLIASWLGASPEVIRSLAPKSVSTPIAIEITRQLGGIPALTSAIVVLVGMIGAMAGVKTMEWGTYKESGVEESEHGHGGTRDGHQPHERVWRPLWGIRHTRTNPKRHTDRLPCRSDSESHTLTSMDFDFETLIC